ncbi:MAG: hypothetical protein SFY56_00220 [Bacteroidota bacterium]|nr:hypothetical protein [Bacteroidota bacterium]
MTYKKAKGLIGLFIFIFLGFLGFSQTKTNKVIEEYKIEDKIVTLKEYKHFTDSLQLKEIEGTYVCKKMVDGGLNFYDAKDKNGIVYVCTSGVKHKKSFNYIRKK